MRFDGGVFILCGCDETHRTGPAVFGMKYGTFEMRFDGGGVYFMRVRLNAPYLL